MDVSAISAQWKAALSVLGSKAHNVSGMGRCMPGHHQEEVGSQGGRECQHGMDR